MILLPAPVVGSSGNSPSVTSVVAASILLPGVVDAGPPTYDGANGNLYVTGFWSPFANGSLTVISGPTNSVIAVATVGWEPVTATVDPDNGNVYVANSAPGCTNCPSGMWIGPQNVTVVSGTTGRDIATIQPVPSPSVITFGPRNGYLYVPDDNYLGGNGSRVSVVSAASNTIVGTIPVGADPTSVFYDGANGDLYVMDQNPYAGIDYPNHLTVVSGSTDTVIGSISLLGTTPSNVLLDGSTGNLYAGGTNGVTVISGATNQVIQTLPIDDGEPTFVDAQGNVYVLQPGSPATVSVISGTSDGVLSTFTVGNAGAMTYDPLNMDMYTTRWGYSAHPNILNVTSTISDKLVESLALGTGGFLPFAPLFDPGNGELYVVQMSGETDVVVVSANHVPSSGSGLASLVPWFTFGGGVSLGAIVAAGILIVVRRRKTTRKTDPEPGRPYGPIG
jgi:DNA-binding beta-propeller fold protein YncE